MYCINAFNFFDAVSNYKKAFEKVKRGNTNSIVSRVIRLKPSMLHVRPSTINGFVKSLDDGIPICGAINYFVLT